MCAEIRWEVQAGHAVERGTAYNRKVKRTYSLPVFWPNSHRNPSLTEVRAQAYNELD
jgi:hypothetical protein